jgi:endonuclease/exonuclease/phosphatase (EEP) superfamily protein YafD
MIFFAASLYLIGTLLLVATILPLWPTSLWWVRLCDFPRFQIVVLAAAVVALLPIASWPLSTPEIAFILPVFATLLWQLSYVWRYLPLAPVEVENSSVRSDSPQRISLLTTNVLQTSRDSGALLEIIAGANPDLVLAVETDEWWCARLREGLAARYPHTLLYPLSNGYGMALFSRLELAEPSVRFLVDEAVPSFKVRIRLRSAASIDLYGLHPQPPAPRQDSTQRDAELVLVGTEIARNKRPAIVLGDLNDVAWSPTTSQFKQVGGLVDPRRGRGFFNTYPARLPGLRYPLDYVFHTPHFAVCEMRVLARFQSDHLPLVVALVLKEA